ncbi:MAG: hypothetical protein IKJ27_05935 [Clostridia bacterium]|nr:hypothetical protein [Clostridia bacterium]
MKKESTVKILCISALFCAFVYGLALPFFWDNNPASELGTLSLLCENRKLFFWLWGILTSGGIFINTQYMYNKFGMKNKLLTAIGALGFVSICAVALTLGHSIDDWNPKRIAHWVATGAFIAFTVASIAFYFIINRKNHPKFNMLTVCTFLILGTFVVIFATVGKSALMEMIPLALIEIFLFAVNFTPWVKAARSETVVK